MSHLNTLQNTSLSILPNTLLKLILDYIIWSKGSVFSGKIKNKNNMKKLYVIVGLNNTFPILYKMSFIEASITKMSNDYTIYEAKYPIERLGKIFHVREAKSSDLETKNWEFNHCPEMRIMRLTAYNHYCKKYNCECFSENECGCLNKA